jgi:hypothetical protein
MDITAVTFLWSANFDTFVCINIRDPALSFLLFFVKSTKTSPQQLFNMVKTSLLVLLALPLVVSARMRGATSEAEEKFPMARQLMGGMDGGGGGSGSCPDPSVSESASRSV